MNSRLLLPVKLGELSLNERLTGAIHCIVPFAFPLGDAGLSAREMLRPKSDK